MSNKSIDTIAVIGAGIMGTGIAQTFASAGLSVWMIDIDQHRLKQGLESIKANLHLFEEFNLLNETPTAVLKRIALIPSSDVIEVVTGSDFIIESVPEVLDTKKAIFNRLDRLPENVIIASNTSSFTMDTLTGNLKTSHRMIGLHYFNPAHIIPAVEIHKGRDTTDEVVAQTRMLMLKTEKKPVVVLKTVPGFIINRLTGAMEREIDYLIDEGIVTAEDLDTAVEASFGFRLACMGPMAQEDMIGLDTAARVSSNIFKVLSNKTTPSPVLLAKVQKGELGIKSGKGWYDYTAGPQQQITATINRRLLRQLALFKSAAK